MKHGGVVQRLGRISSVVVSRLVEHQQSIVFSRAKDFRQRVLYVEQHQSWCLQECP